MQERKRKFGMVTDDCVYGAPLSPGSDGSDSSMDCNGKHDLFDVIFKLEFCISGHCVGPVLVLVSVNVQD